MELTYIVAPAGNLVELVLMAFPTRQAAHDHLISLGFLPPRDETYDTVTVAGEAMPLRIALGTLGSGTAKQDAAHNLRCALFAGGHYDDGCGECYALELRTLPVGAPVVAWDLD